MAIPEAAVVEADVVQTAVRDGRVPLLLREGKGQPKAEAEPS